MPYGCVGSSPTSGTIQNLLYLPLALDFIRFRVELNFVFNCLFSHQNFVCRDVEI